MSVRRASGSTLYKRALFLSYFTVGYDILEGLVSVFVGLLAGSIALLGFGLDSFIESISGSVMIWRFRKHGGISEVEEDKVEKRATKWIGYTFFILAVYVLYESAKKLYSWEISAPSVAGIIIAVLSIVVMPILFFMKYRIGKLIGSKSLIADSKQTLACSFLAFAVLIGLGLNYLFGLWQADPIAGLLVAAFLLWEGYETLKGD